MQKCSRCVACSVAGELSVVADITTGVNKNSAVTKCAETKQLVLLLVFQLLPLSKFEMLGDPNQISPLKGKASNLTAPSKSFGKPLLSSVSLFVFIVRCCAGSCC